MRVIAGRFRSRVLKSVPGLDVRPTPDRLREALFNILAPRISGATFIDAYAGSGSIGIEALSRGAGRVILIENNRDALAVINNNARALGIEDEITILRGSAALLLPSQQADIVFLDPPYEREKEYSASLSALEKTGCKFAIAQHSSRLTLDEAYGSLRKHRILRQGDNLLSFFELVTPGSSSSE